MLQNCFPTNQNFTLFLLICHGRELNASTNILRPISLVALTFLCFSDLIYFSSDILLWKILFIFFFFSTVLWVSSTLIIKSFRFGFSINLCFSLSLLIGLVCGLLMYTYRMDSMPFLDFPFFYFLTLLTS